MIAIDTIPASACVVVVPRASDNVPMCVIGVAIEGSADDLAAAAAWAKAHNLSTTPSKGQNGVDETLIFLMRSGTLSDLVQIKRQFGKLKLQAFVAPQSAAADGLDLDTEVKAGNIDLLKIPS